MLPPYCVSIPRTDVPLETILGFQLKKKDTSATSESSCRTFYPPHYFRCRRRRLLVCRSFFHPNSLSVRLFCVLFLVSTPPAATRFLVWPCDPLSTHSFSHYEARQHERQHLVQSLNQSFLLLLLLLSCVHSSKCVRRTGRIGSAAKGCRRVSIAKGQRQGRGFVQSSHKTAT